MTLCVAWIREKDRVEELVFATDSALTGGEKWNQGIKLFELPRPDCLICFAGSTMRAYPLILNLISAIKLDNHLRNPRTNFTEVLDHISVLFTALVRSIKVEVRDQDVHEARAEAKFLLGAWSWADNRFRVWKLFYSTDAEGFLFTELTNDPQKTRTYVFLGDPDEGQDNVETEASNRLKQFLFVNDKQDDKLDMEPMAILSSMARDSQFRHVDGALQIAKIYKSGTSEFFGIYWPSVEGTPHFQGRPVPKHYKLEARFFDPDTLNIVEDELPVIIQNMNQIAGMEEADFVRGCYDEQGSLKSDLQDAQRKQLRSILLEEAYRKYKIELATEADHDLQ